MHEVGGGYIWCPHTDVNGHERETYTNLTRVAAGDLVFSYADRAIRAIGAVRAPYVDAPKPAYGAAGTNWGADGWLVTIDWKLLTQPFEPLLMFAQLQPLMPERHSPLTSAGKGAMNVYLAGITPQLGQLLIGLISVSNPEVQDEVDDASAMQQVLNANIPATTKKQLVEARKGQGIFRDRVTAIARTCRVSNTSDPRVLVASHIKPWSKSTDEERLDGENGFLLAPHVDKLFDRFLISFEDDGSLITAGPGVDGLMRSWNLDPMLHTAPLRAGQRHYMAYHRGRLAEVAAMGLWQ
ncbi:HNH endonuclease [Variovorax paradoxus]|uniref:HNH endonuclease n=1 Tax=Variovorax paradoxus TaxID=34073 RepID=UPI00286D1A58|nr:HNH endonuclease signature motif containing protein [Variovorax paradoxus]